MKRHENEIKSVLALIDFSSIASITQDALEVIQEQLFNKKPDTEDIEYAVEYISKLLYVIDRKRLNYDCSVLSHMRKLLMNWYNDEVWIAQILGIMHPD